MNNYTTIRLYVVTNPCSIFICTVMKIMNMDNLLHMDSLLHI